ncbi:hypothetical protein EJB05_23221, partial [Eragrostis curvula]
MAATPSSRTDSSSPAVEQEEKEKPNCDLFRCICRWRKTCSPRIPRVAPGRDYVHPSVAGAGADDRRPTWSVLAGCIAATVPYHNLRMHRFRVAASGRVLGRSDDVLQHFATLSPNDGDRENTFVAHAAAALAPVDRRWLYGPLGRTRRRRRRHRAFAMDLADGSFLSPSPPPLPFVHGSYDIVSAHGDLWAAIVLTKPDPGKRLVVHRLDERNTCWVEAAGVDVAHRPHVNSSLGGFHLQGYAVVGDRFILLSLRYSTFFCFDCATGALDPVAIAGKDYCLPISGKAVSLGEGDDDKYVYFIRWGTLYAYRFSPEERRLVAPAVEVERLWPYDDKGHGRVVRLAGRMMCAVLINVDAFVVVKGDGGDKPSAGVEVLHSTCRRVDKLRTNEEPQYERYDYYCFLQFFLGPKFKEYKLETKPDFYFICQADEQSLLYRVGSSKGKLDCHDKTLEAQLCLDTVRPGREIALDEPAPSWHFVHQGSRLHVIPSSSTQCHYEVDLTSNLVTKHEGQSAADRTCFSVVSRAGQYIVGLGDTLQDVYVLDQQTFQWLRIETSTSPVDLTRKVKIYGFVDLIDDILVVSDADSAECFLLDLRKKEWFVVKPPPGTWRRIQGVLCGKCLLADGFIYTCTGIRFAAFELLKEDDSYCLSRPVLMEFPAIEFLDKKMVSFDLICKENDPGSLVFCVVEGCLITAPFTSRHILSTTTVEVKLKQTARGRKVPLRIDQEGWIWTNYAFSL